MFTNIEEYLLNDAGIFPNSILPVVLYRGVVHKWIPGFMMALYFKKLFRHNNWTNNSSGGIDPVHHYHSNTYEVLGIYKGSTTLQLGGQRGISVRIEKGDVIMIPAGVAHTNLGKLNTVRCMSGYPDGKQFDIKYGESHERPLADLNIAVVDMPLSDPVLGEQTGIVVTWENHLTTLLKLPVYD